MRLIHASMPISSGHSPSATPSTISLPANAPSNSRIKAGCVITHEPPGAPTEASTYLCPLVAHVLLFKALGVVNIDRDILAPPA